MNVYRDEATGYLIIDDISDGVYILPSELYQSYLKQIKDLTEQNKDLQNKLDLMHTVAESERATGIAIGMLFSKTGYNYRLAKLYWYEFEKWYEEAFNNGTIDAIDEAYELECATKNTESIVAQNE